MSPTATRRPLRALLRAFRNHRYVLPDAPALTRRPSDRKPTASTAARRLRSGGVYSAGRAARRLTQPGHSSQRRRAPGRRRGSPRPPFPSRPPPLTRGAHVNFLAGRTRPLPLFVSPRRALPGPGPLSRHRAASPPRYLGPPGPRPPPPAALPRSPGARRARGGGAEGRGGQGRASGGRSAVPGGSPRRPARAGRDCPSYSRRGTWIKGSAGTWRGQPTSFSSAPTGAGCSSPASTATVSSGDGARSHPLP